jgi:cyanophycinase
MDRKMRRLTIRISFWIALAAVTLFPRGRAGLWADDAPAGRLLIIGGGTKRSSVEIYSRLIEGAGGKDRARIGILPTASRSLEGSKRISALLVRFGLPADQIEILNLTPLNAAEQAINPELVAQVRQCTGLFIAGGDQRRVTAALIAPDGTERPVLTAMRDVLHRGGMIAGSSAGAAVQSELMLAVSGLPPDSLDEGFDALDFGLQDHPARRGLHVSRGLGFFRGGMVDQHFNEYRGRLGRLARAATEHRSRWAFGIDENTALDVTPDGWCEVVGAGSVTILDMARAKCIDGPLGCRLTNVGISVLQQGDRFDPRTGEARIHPNKHEIQPGKEESTGNNLIPDIAGEGAINFALISGLAENTHRRQVGVMLKHARDFSHGYRFVFSKTQQTRSFGGYVDQEYSNAIVQAIFDVEPIVNGLRPSSSVVPVDLNDDESRAVWFRGLLLADDANRLRPDAAITTGELAGAMARFIHLEPPRKPVPRIINIAEDSPEFEELERVLGAGLVALEPNGSFAESATLSRVAAAPILVRACELYRGEKLAAEPVAVEDLIDETPAERAAIFAAIGAGLLPLDGQKYNPGALVTRREIAIALCKIIDFDW